MRGFVKDDDGEPIEGARISVANRRHDTFTTKDGDYWRILVPGSYEIEVSAPGYDSESKTCTVIQDKETNLDFALKKMRIKKTSHHEAEDDYPRNRIPVGRAFRGEEEGLGEGRRAHRISRRELDTRGHYGDALSDDYYSPRMRDRYSSELNREDEKRSFGSFGHARPLSYVNDKPYYLSPK